MAGGDFWDGLCNGLISSGLNHAMHLVVEGGVFAKGCLALGISSTEPIPEELQNDTFLKKAQENSDVFTNFSKMYFNKSFCFRNAPQMFKTMGHELIHVYHHFYLKNVDHIYSERLTHEYSYNVYSSAGYHKMANAELLSAIKLGYGLGVYPGEYIIPSNYPFYVNYIP